jgi:acyl-coenzyme A thioesterase PaaI-like protein
MPLMTARDLTEFMHRAYPQSRPDRFRIESVTDDSVRFRYSTTDDDLRPGNTVSGPTLMALSDVGMYFTVLARIGPVALAVTTSLNINFLNKPVGGELVVETKLLKLGKRLAVGEVFVHNDGSPDPVSHATVTYSIPPR